MLIGDASPREGGTGLCPSAAVPASRGRVLGNLSKFMPPRRGAAATAQGSKAGGWEPWGGRGGGDIVSLGCTLQVETVRFPKGCV